MPTYLYKARDKSGTPVKGVREAPNELVVADRLSDLGYYIISIEEQPEGISARGLFTRQKKVKLQNLVTFTRQLATMIRAGLTFSSSLEILAKQTENETLRKLIAEVKRDVEGGSSLSDALAKHPRIFSGLYVSMVSAGEAGGVLESILERLIVVIERTGETRSRLRAALTYPVIVVCIALLVVGVLATVVFPRFMSIFAGTHQLLPLPTRMLIGLSDFMRHYWWMLLLGIGLFLLIFRWYGKTGPGRFAIDKFKLKIPIFGDLIRKVIVSRFARTLATLYTSGVPILDSLEIVQRTIGNEVIARVVGNIRGSVKEGESIAEPMRVSGVFPPMVVEMVTVGEATGAIDKLLVEVADAYDREVDYALRNLTSALEPVLILVIGAIVAFIALAMFMPYFGMIELHR